MSFEGAGIEKRNFKKINNPEKATGKDKKLSDEFISSLKFQEWIAGYYNRERKLKDLLKGTERLPGLKAEIDKLPKDKPARILDLGCGKGTAVEELKKKYLNWEIHGIDLLRPQKEGIEKEGKGEIIRGEASLLPYKSNQFDIVYSKIAYPYFVDKIKALVEALRVTKIGGVILVSADTGQAYELVEDPNVIKELEDKGVMLYRHIPGSEPGEVLKPINILKELHNRGIAGISKKDIDKIYTPAIIHIRKSKGDDERAKKLPFKFLKQPMGYLLSGNYDSFYKKEE